MKNLVFIFFMVLSYYANAQNTIKPGDQKPVATLDHISHYVKNLDTSVNFYIKYFQLDSIKNPFKIGRTKWFKISPGIQFHLIEGAKNKVVIPEFSHLCFSVNSLNVFIKNCNIIICHTMTLLVKETRLIIGPTASARYLYKTRMVTGLK